MNREPIFNRNADKHYYLTRLSKALERHANLLHAFVLMTNHVHLLLTPNENYSIRKTIQMPGRYYVQYFNRRYNRTGTLWEGRYKSTLIDSEQYLLTSYRYIELNPARVEMESHPSEYPWSSYRCNGIGRVDPLVTEHDKYMGLGATDKERQTNYRSLFNTQITDFQLDEIRQPANKEWVLGSKHFKMKLEQQLQRRTTPHPSGGDRKSQHFKKLAQINRH